jgi:hypothetical protein
MLSRISPQPNHFVDFLLLVLSQRAPRRIATLHPPTDHREALLLKHFFESRQKICTAYGAHSLNPKLSELGHARGVKHAAARRTKDAAVSGSRQMVVGFPVARWQSLLQKATRPHRVQAKILETLPWDERQLPQQLSSGAGPFLSLVWDGFVPLKILSRIKNPAEDFCLEGSRWCLSAFCSLSVVVQW